jgi:hypothetical protein
MTNCGRGIAAARQLRELCEGGDLTVMLLGHRQRIDRAGGVSCASRGPAMPISTLPG